MSEATTTLEAPVAATTKAAPKPKATPKKTTLVKPAVTATADRTKTIHGVTCPTGKFFNTGRKLIIGAMRKCNADSVNTALDVKEITKKIGVVDFHVGKVANYLANQEPLIAGNLVKKVKTEEGIKFHLTANGRKCNLEA